jgi:ubiquinone/menaquinone biosynthesis C-methylase UbiE
MSKKALRPGDFTGLAYDYSINRPDYCPTVLDALLALVGVPVEDIDFVDIGAGTGIWSRMVAQRCVRSAIAVEPNDDMRTAGISDSKTYSIRWVNGRAEETGLSSNSCDWVSMASSFHWADFERATREFARILRPKGLFTALWNPRLIECNPLLLEIEQYLKSLRPDIKRVSSGRSGITESLTERLWESPYFEDVIYIEGRHVINVTSARYLGAWRSVNDLQVQLGRSGFDQFLRYVEGKVSGLTSIEATYWTRAWSAKCRGVKS